MADVLCTSGTDRLSVKLEVTAGLEVVSFSVDAVCEPGTDSGEDPASLEMIDMLAVLKTDCDIVDFCLVSESVVIDGRLLLATDVNCTCGSSLVFSFVVVSVLSLDTWLVMALVFELDMFVVPEDVLTVVLAGFEMVAGTFVLLVRDTGKD